MFGVFTADMWVHSRTAFYDISGACAPLHVIRLAVTHCHLCRLRLGVLMGCSVGSAFYDISAALII